MPTGPDLPSARLAKGVTSVTTGGVKLFVGFGSLVGEPTLATFVKEPLADAVTINVRFVT